MPSENSDHLTLMGYYKLHLADAETFRAIAAASVVPTRGKDGCLYYSFAEDVAEPGLFRVAEGWRNREALDSHLASPDFAETLRQAGKLRIVERQIHTFTAGNGQSLS
jgi:quinol monooxygenase YgiN